MKICVAGAYGAFGLKHLDALANIEEVEVTSVMGPTQAKIEALAAELGLTPRARIVATGNMGDDPTLMLNAPVPSTRKVLERAGMTLDDIDLIEINEAFASQSVYCVNELGLDPEKTNVNGGAIATGHPLGATGAVLTVKLLGELIEPLAALSGAGEYPCPGIQEAETLPGLQLLPRVRKVTLGKKQGLSLLQLMR